MTFELLGYTAADFQLFGWRTWARLVEGWTRSTWPVAPLALVALGALLAAAWWRPESGARWLAGGVAVACVGAATFCLLRYAPVHWGAPWMAAAFAAQALLMAEAAARAPGRAPSGLARGATGLLALSAVAGWPLATAVLAGSAMQAQVPGLLPAPTWLAALLPPLFLRGPRRPLGLLLPVAGCMVEALTLASLDQPLAAAPLAAAALALGAAGARR